MPSAPVGLRAAIQACRPKTLHGVRLRYPPPIRPYSSRGARITKGFPDVPYPQVEDAGRTESKITREPRPSPALRGQSSMAQANEQSAGARGLARNDVADATRTEDAEPLPESKTANVTPPLNVLAAFHRPLKRKLPPGADRLPSCDLHLRSFSVRNLEFMTDFALRAAFYLGLCATGPVPLPKKIERWTVIRSNFIFKKSKENFERITYKRLIQIKDSHPEAVEIWLSFLRRHQFYGVGMKANVWEYASLDVGKDMDCQMEEISKDLDNKLSMFGWNKQVADNKTIADMLEKGLDRHVGVPMTAIREASQTADNKD